MKIDKYKIRFYKYLNSPKFVLRKDKNRVVNLDYYYNPMVCDEDIKAENLYNTIENNKVIFHTYWHGIIGRKQIASILSVLATQQDYNYEIYLWIDEKSKESNDNNVYFNFIKDMVTVKYYSPKLVKESKYCIKSAFLFADENNLAARSDGFRFFALNQYGGIYFDLDVLFVRNIKNLLFNSEFVYAWENQPYANSAVIYLRKNSYNNIYIEKKIEKIHSTQPWAVFNYEDKNLRSLMVYNAVLFDPLWVKSKNKYFIKNFSEFFTKPIEMDIASNESVFPYSYAYHWHNEWKTIIAKDSLFERMEINIYNKLELKPID